VDAVGADHFHMLANVLEAAHHLSPLGVRALETLRRRLGCTLPGALTLVSRTSHRAKAGAAGLFG
jgi:hypothetical protein